MTRRTGIGLVAALVVGLAIVTLLQRPVDPLVRVIPVGLAPTAMALDARAGQVLIFDSNRVSLLDAATGVMGHSTILGPAAFPLALVVDAQRDYCFVYARDGTVYVVDTRDGRVMQRTALTAATSTSNEVALAVAARAGRVFALNYRANTVTMLDAGSGRVLRTVRVAGVPTATLDARNNRVAIAAATDAVPERILDADTGRDVLATPSPCYRGRVRRGARASAPQPHHAYATEIATDPEAGTSSMLDGRSHAVLCTFLYGRTTGGVAFAVDGQAHHVFVPDVLHNRIRIVDERSGSTVGSVRVPGALVALALDGVHHRLLVQSSGKTDAVGHVLGYGALSILDTRSGALVRTLRVGIAPLDIAADERTGRAFVLSANVNPDATAINLPAPTQGVLDDLRHYLPWLPLGPASQPPSTGYVSVLDTSKM